ncbi:MAG: hypothetical protein HOW73_48290 [Polyangiaceae bacterium]|nr:hypothetical protein [Polyangiaceae bacterium]
MDEASISHTLEVPWLQVEPLVLGPVPTGQDTPHCYVCVGDPNPSGLRIDVYAHRDHYCFREDAVLIGGMLFIGVGHRLFAIQISTHSVLAHDLDCYFGYLHRLSDSVLVATGCSLYRFALDGSLGWVATNLAVDGLLVRHVRDDIVVLDAEQDPPGQWEHVCVSLHTGLVI